MTARLSQRAAAEFVGTTFLLIAVIGSGIMSERLAGGNVGLALLTNVLAIGAALVALILTFGPISGAHFNPVVTLSFRTELEFSGLTTLTYLAAQTIGALAGVMIAHVMFGMPLISLSQHDRSGWGIFLGEFVATFGLIATIRGCALRNGNIISFAVAAYIVAACWFTSSLSFANPVVTLARSLTDSFTGISWHNVPQFVVAQLLGALAATYFFRWIARGSHQPEHPPVELDATGDDDDQ